MQLSACVHGSPSSHSPLLSLIMHTPLVGSHLPTLHFGKSLSQTNGVPTHLPPMHLSSLVHLSPSLQLLFSMQAATSEGAESLTESEFWLASSASAGALPSDTAPSVFVVPRSFVPPVSAVVLPVPTGALPHALTLAHVTAASNATTAARGKKLRKFMVPQCVRRGQSRAGRATLRPNRAAGNRCVALASAASQQRRLYTIL